MVVGTEFDDRTGPAYMETFSTTLECLDRGNVNSAEQTARFARAMGDLVGLAGRHHREPNADWVARDLPGFRLLAHDLLDRHRTILSRYLAGMETAVWAGTPEDWLTARIRRSAIQIVTDELDSDGDPPLIEPRRILANDDEMRRMAPSTMAFPAYSVPALPPSHWWWRIPDPQAV